MFFNKVKTKSYFRLKKVNPVIKFLTISDVLIISGFGLVTPIFAVFITDNIKGGTLEVAGIAIAVFLIAKSLGQVPIAAVIDNIKGEIDDFWILFVGSLVFSLMPLFYIIVATPMQLYLVQFFSGLATAAALPAWYAIFTRHIDKEHEGIEWGVYQTLVDLGGAGAASLGGFLAFRFGFAHLFIMVSAASFVGSFFLLGIYQNMKEGTVPKTRARVKK